MSSSYRNSMLCCFDTCHKRLRPWPRCHGDQAMAKFLLFAPKTARQASGFSRKLPWLTAKTFELQPQSHSQPERSRGQAGPRGRLTGATARMELKKKQTKEELEQLSAELKDRSAKLLAKLGRGLLTSSMQLAAPCLQKIQGAPFSDQKHLLPAAAKWAILFVYTSINP